MTDKVINIYAKISAVQFLTFYLNLSFTISSLDQSDFMLVVTDEQTVSLFHS